MTFFDLFKGIQKKDRADRLKQLEAASLRQDDSHEEDAAIAALDSIKIKDENEPSAPPKLETPISLHQEQASEEAQQQSLALPQPGGLYAMQERNGGLHRLVKVVHAEDGLVHVVRYAGRFLQLTELLATQQLTVGLDPQDGSFGAEHLPIPVESFNSNSIHIQDSQLEERDFFGWRLYLDSIYDCLSETAPKWLRKAGSYAAWRDDRNAMAVLAERYLIGADLPRDSKKALYWLNRIVQQGIGVVQAGTQVQEEYQIVTGGLYAWAEDDGSYAVGRVVLKDRQGVQFLIGPDRFTRLAKIGNLVALLEHRSEKFSHASLTTDNFLSCGMTFIGLLPITLAELHCYRTHLRSICDETGFQASAFAQLLQRAEAGEAEVQHEVAKIYLRGDLEWEVEQDIAEAARLLTDAANLGYAPSAFTLARICREGAGDILVPDLQLSFEWLSYAAQLNYGPAQLEIARSCLQGQGCPQNPALAHAWYSLAASTDNGLPEAQKEQARAKRQQLDVEMTAAQRAKAREYIRQMQSSLSR